jgi:hypothetical protein
MELTNGRNKMNLTFKERCVWLVGSLLVLVGLIYLIAILIRPIFIQPSDTEQAIQQAPTNEMTYAMIQPPLAQDEIQMCLDAAIAAEWLQKEWPAPDAKQERTFSKAGTSFVSLRNEAIKIELKRHDTLMRRQKYLETRRQLEERCEALRNTKLSDLTPNELRFISVYCN